MRLLDDVDLHDLLFFMCALMLISTAPPLIMCASGVGIARAAFGEDCPPMRQEAADATP